MEQPEVEGKHEQASTKKHQYTATTITGGNSACLYLSLEDLHGSFFFFSEPKWKYTEQAQAV